LRKSPKLILDLHPVCAIEHTISDDMDNITEVIPIAGDLRGSITGGGDLNAKVTRLKTEDSNWGSEKEGLRIVLNGGVHGNPKRKQRAIIEFLCPMDDTESGKDLDPEGTLKYTGYDRKVPDSVVDTLRLEWTTKYACEKDTPAGGHWGFFTWFLIM
jgi:autophagy-related protein 27